MRFRMVTLGCKVNQYETQYVRTALLANGYEEVPDGSEDMADLVVVNTCSVTAESDAKSRKAISRVVRQSPHAAVHVMGCFVSKCADEVQRLHGVTGSLSDKRKLDEYLVETLGLAVLPRKITGFDEHSRAFVKIQDGCRVGCAYCIIPSVRPYLQSRCRDEIIDEVKTLCDNGYREIVLTGIHLGHYGLDFLLPRATSRTSLDDYLDRRRQTPQERQASLARLLESLVDLDLPVRYRLGSLEAVEVGEELLDVVAGSSGRVCPHFHLSMQSGDDVVLKRMGRRWLSGPFRQKCWEIKERMPDLALTTDVIVGFPGETAEQFVHSCNVVQELEFSKVHVFRFSPRPGTKAAIMPDQISNTVKKERSDTLQTLASQVRRTYMRRFIGKQVEILLESRREESNGFAGTTEHYLPALLAPSVSRIPGSEIASGKEVSSPVKCATDGTYDWRGGVHGCGAIVPATIESIADATPEGETILIASETFSHRLS